MKQFAKAMSFITFAITLLCSNNRAFGQVTEKHDYKNDVENNILIYRIRESNLFNELKADVTSEIAPDFLNLLPPSSFKLKLSFIKLDSLQYPLGGYDIYQARNMNYAYTNGEVSKEVYTYDAKPNLRSRYYLIAYNKDEQRTIYICGDFFKSIVSVDFDIDVNNPKSLYNYLSFKTQCLQVLNIRYTGNQDEFLRYEGYSKLLKKDVDIIVDKQFPDNVRIN